MLIEVNSNTYHEHFPADPHQFISRPFIELNSGKAERIVRLIDDSGKAVIGLVAGINNGELQSPFSAPFGGFHFLKENIYISEIDRFLAYLQEYVASQELKGVEIILPPDIYHSTFNAKTISSLIRRGFQLKTPEITNWVNLLQFKGAFSQKNSREYYRQAIRNGLFFDQITETKQKMEAYDLICQNRAKFDRHIFMTFKDIENTSTLWPVDFFKVSTNDNRIAASAIFYRNHSDICYAVFWGDNEEGRLLRAMDFLLLNLWNYYKNMGFKYVDLGISTEEGHPNEGLLRFKESHEAESSLRYKFFWKVQIQ